MLISHRKRFIFTKTLKTAGTSIESFFEPYCMPEGQWEEAHYRNEYVSDSGVIGQRGPGRAKLGRGKATWVNHMPAYKIRQMIGAEVWNQYFKFTAVRNPFDKLISGFSQAEARTSNYSAKDKLKAYARRLIGRAKPIEHLTGKTEVERFRQWIKSGGNVVDRDKYFIDEKVCVDFFIRFEDLPGGIKAVCDRLSIEMPERTLPEFKSGLRRNDMPIHAYYDDETEAIVRRLYAWEFKEFGYTMP